MQSAVQYFSSQSNGATCQREDGALIILMKNDPEMLFKNPELPRAVFYIEVSMASCSLPQ